MDCIASIIAGVGGVDILSLGRDIYQTAASGLYESSRKYHEWNLFLIWRRIAGCVVYTVVFLTRAFNIKSWKSILSTGNFLQSSVARFSNSIGSNKIPTTISDYWKNHPGANTQTLDFFLANPGYPLPVSTVSVKPNDYVLCAPIPCLIKLPKPKISAVKFSSGKRPSHRCDLGEWYVKSRLLTRTPSLYIVIRSGEM